ncbi:MAG: elongation factor P [Bacteroidetes bacterium]|nr:MAG: elongation factor P [Bacteroidota bacterium]REK07597.1 MAG: elongation factor P [Bacteroidota bacterium]REK36971.1 MAG: elongation factor P [Bacteroidota bacterium]REK47791.1 MAG: elongation factor P [Bacteroidota bacterium]
MADIGDVRTGTILKYNGELCQVTEIVHRTPGNLRAFYQAKMKNLKTGKIVENRFRAGEAVDIARVEFKEMQFIYPEGENMVVMDNETFEQVYVPAEMFGENAKLLKEGMTVKVAFENEQPLTAEAPTFVELEITYTEPGVKGDTATNTLKPATVETGATVNVPLFVNTGEVVKIDTRDWSYAGKVK